MKQRTLALIIALLACATTAPAASYSWLGIGTTNNWTDAGNWWNLTTGPTAVAPAAGDFAYIGFPAGDFSGTPRPVINTVLYTVGAPLTYLSMDYWDASQAPENSQLTIAAGGGLEVSNTLMNFQGQETATINITGGYLRSHNQLQMAVTAGGTSQINIDSGFMVAQTLFFGPGTSNIDLELGAALYIGGDQTANMASWISSGKISGGSGSLSVQYDLTAIPGYTHVYAIPEPSAAALLGFVALAVLRRRRR